MFHFRGLDSKTRPNLRGITNIAKYLQHQEVENVYVTPGHIILLNKNRTALKSFDAVPIGVDKEAEVSIEIKNAENDQIISVNLDNQESLILLAVTKV